MGLIQERPPDTCPTCGRERRVYVELTGQGGPGGTGAVTVHRCSNCGDERTDAAAAPGAEPLIGLVKE